MLHFAKACVPTRKKLVIAVTAGVLTSALCYWVLPPAPFASIPMPECMNGFRVVFSPTMRYLAFTEFAPEDDKCKLTKITIWDVSSRAPLCSFPVHNEFANTVGSTYRQAFTHDETTFVEIVDDEARLRDSKSGIIKSTKALPQSAFGIEADETNKHGALLWDANGRLLYLTRKGSEKWSLSDLVTDEEILSLTLPAGLTYFSPTNFLVRCFSRAAPIRGLG